MPQGAADPETGKRRLVLEELKTERSRRTIRMPRHVATVLQALRRDQAAKRLKVGELYDFAASGSYSAMTLAP